MTRHQWIYGMALWLSLIAMMVAIPGLPLLSHKVIEAKFLTPEGPNKALVFFGFSHCKEVCPATLAQLNTLLTQQLAPSQWPRVVFVDLQQSPQRDKEPLKNKGLSRKASPGSNRADPLTLAAGYAQSFHPQFHGYHPTADELLRLAATFGLNFSQRGELIQHRGRSYLLERKNAQWRLIKTYNAGQLGSLKPLAEFSASRAFHRAADNPQLADSRVQSI